MLIDQANIKEYIACVLITQLVCLSRSTIYTYENKILPIINIDGAQTSMAYWKSSLRTQWYSKERQLCLSAVQDKQFFFKTASLYDDRVDGHFVARFIVSIDALQGTVKASKRFIYKQSENSYINRSQASQLFFPKKMKTIHTQLDTFVNYMITYSTRHANKRNYYF